MLNVIKRDGRKEIFDKTKISIAISRASEDIKKEIKTNDIEELVTEIVKKVGYQSIEIDIDSLHKIVESTLLENSSFEDVGNAYKKYRETRDENRNRNTRLFNSVQEIYKETTKENANIGGGMSGKLLQAASTVNKFVNSYIIPKEFIKAHENFDIHIHDLDNYFNTINCLQIPTGKMLERGFNPAYGSLSKPKRITSAASLSCILLQSTQNSMFGGQSHHDYDNDLAEYVQLTREEVYEEYSDLEISDVKRKEKVEARVRKETLQAGQITICNLSTMHSRAGAQVPFSSLNIGLPKNDDAALVCESILLAYENGIGGKTPIFPNLIFRVKDGVNKKPGDKYYWLFQLACRVASKRMNPTFVLVDNPGNIEWYEKGIMPTRMG